MTYRTGYNLLIFIDRYFANLHITLCNILLTDYVLLYKSIINLGELDLNEDEQLVEPRLKLIYVGRNGHKG